MPLWQGVYESLVGRAGIVAGSKVLDVGTGTGEVALRASKLVGQRGFVVAVDIMDEMLRIASRKAGGLGTTNVKFSRMSIEELDLPEASFDSVVGNYSLCCCLDYEAALVECMRVLKPGGRLTYNHSGPADPLELQLALRIFERYQTKKPSRRLQEIREAEMAQEEAVEKYRDPFVTLELIKSLGYREAEATITQRVIRYRDTMAFIEGMLGFDWRSEADEMPEMDLLKFKSEATEALGFLSGDSEFLVKDEMVFFSGRKP